MAEMIPCADCDLEFSSAYSLGQHRRYKHADGPTQVDAPGEKPGEKPKIETIRVKLPATLAVAMYAEARRSGCTADDFIAEALAKRLGFVRKPVHKVIGYSWERSA